MEPPLRAFQIQNHCFSQNPTFFSCHLRGFVSLELSWPSVMSLNVGFVATGSHLKRRVAARCVFTVKWKAYHRDPHTASCRERTRGPSAGCGINLSSSRRGRPALRNRPAAKLLPGRGVINSCPAPAVGRVSSPRPLAPYAAYREQCWASY